MHRDKAALPYSAAASWIGRSNWPARTCPKYSYPSAPLRAPIRPGRATP